MTSHSTQLSAATALVQLLQEHPELPMASWEIGAIFPDSLYGFIHESDIGALAAYADVLGGAVRAAGEYKRGEQRVRRHVLKTRWRDVQVEVAVALPVAESAQVAA